MNVSNPVFYKSLDIVPLCGPNLCGPPGGWAETKYRLFALYNELFSTGMKTIAEAGTSGLAVKDRASVARNQTRQLRRLRA